MPNLSESVVKEVKVLIAQSCQTPCNPIDCNPPGSSVHGILQGRILEWVAVLFSKGSSQLRDQTQVSCIAGRSFTVWATREAWWNETKYPNEVNFKWNAQHQWISRAQCLRARFWKARLPGFVNSLAVEICLYCLPLNFILFICKMGMIKILSWQVLSIGGLLFSHDGYCLGRH